MTSRALISIGCNNYLYCHSLRGAETDAKRVFEKLIAPQVGDYDLDSSCLLLSPTLSEVQTAIMRILFGSNSIDTFTVFFAGHGNIKAGSFYMCLKDSRSDALSATALSLSDLFLKIGEARPNQSNIIIDACESGGLIADLNVILKPELLGKSGTPGVTLLAATAGDQFASETAEGGIATTALLSCIEGNTFIQDLTSTLDLIEIGRKISSDTGGRVDQTPIVWGLNLYGPPRFCRNPHFHPGNAASLRGVLSAWPASTDAPVERHMSALWDLYLTVDRNWSPRSFRAILDPVLSDIASSPHNLVTFVERLSAALGERADLSNDRFRSTEVVAACSVALLAHSEDTNGLVASKLQNTILKVIEFGGRALTSAVTRLKADRYALLPERGGFADLFYLPCRISRLIGWGGTVVHLSRRIGMRHEDVERCFTELLDLIIEHYSTLQHIGHRYD
jgi:Caspase domain